MPLESLTNPDAPIKINRLHLESPEVREELPFDPERDITPEDWLGMEQELKQSRQNYSWWAFTSQAANMAILNPNRAKELITPADWQGMEQKLEQKRQNNNRRAFTYQAAAMAKLARLYHTPKTTFNKPTPPMPERRNF